MLVYPPNYLMYANATLAMIRLGECISYDSPSIPIYLGFLATQELARYVVCNIDSGSWIYGA
jgi:hypothetical protein